jgi:D-serine deaminase-like pyridoxal phosphate-dependent protein
MKLSVCLLTASTYCSTLVYRVLHDSETAICCSTLQQLLTVVQRITV